VARYYANIQPRSARRRAGVAGTRRTVDLPCVCPPLSKTVIENAARKLNNSFDETTVAWHATQISTPCSWQYSYAIGGRQAMSPISHGFVGSGENGPRRHLRSTRRRIPSLSVDAHWLVPHFEKMLYDNAQLIRLYADAYRITDPLTGVCRKPWGMSSARCFSPKGFLCHSGCRQ
jgi:hypothetical protein